jgi:predicted AlkP superfamily phosphohydrolase/phosphomutase
MRYLRMLTNSAIGGLAFALYLTILVLQINPRYPLMGTPGLTATLTLSYGFHAAAVFYALIVLRQLLATAVISPGWISFRFLVWLCSASAGIATLLTWVNLRGLAPFMDPEAVTRMTGGVVVLTVCAGVMVALALGHWWAGRHSSRPGAAVLAAALMASFAIPLMLRGPGAGPTEPARWPAAAPNAAGPGGEARVVMVLLEGASLGLIAPAAAEGRLPNFERLIERGASLHLATMRPAQPGPVWTAVATGKLPFKNGIRSSATYTPLASTEVLEVLPDYCYSHALVEFGFLRERAHDSGDLSALPVWSLLGSQGVPVGVVNWSVTQPARSVRGYLVSDHFERRYASVVDVENIGVIWPREAVPAALTAAGEARHEASASPPKPADDAAHLVAHPCAADRAHEQIAAALEARYPSRFQAVRYECLDAVGHYFLRYAVPGAFGDVSDAELQRYAGVLPAHYAAVDEMLGRAMAGLRTGDLLLVVSGFGMEPMSVGKRLLERTVGNPEPSGTHEPAPDGFLFAYGTDVRPGRQMRGAMVDIVPTILYFYGLPLGRDMDGFARTDIFTPAFSAGRPITFIPSYE